MMRTRSYFAIILMVTLFAVPAMAATYTAADPKPAKGNKVGQGTVDVKYPKKVNPKGGMCPEKYFCKVWRSLDKKCIYDNGRNVPNSERNCETMKNFCARQTIQLPEHRVDFFRKICPDWKNSQGR